MTGLCGGKLPGKPLDGMDIWPLLSGQRQQMDRDPLLYFDLLESAVRAVGQLEVTRRAP